MNAIKFIQQHGVDKAREELKKLPNSDVTHMTDDARMFVDENNPLLDEFQRNQIKDLICIDDLKRLVESIGLVNKLGGIAIAKEKLAYGNSISAMRLSYETTITNRDGTKQNVITGVYLEDLEQAIADYEAIGGEHV